jgi:curved DNA-binding protein
MPRCYYAVLRVEKTATPEMIRKAYKRECLAHHPDKNLDNVTEAEENFKSIQEAFAVLSDAEQRRRYDMYGHSGEPAPAPQHQHWQHPDQYEQQYYQQQQQQQQQQPRARRAHDPFAAFGGDPFADFFGAGLFGSMFGHQPGRQRGSQRSHSLFDDPFFSEGNVQQCIVCYLLTDSFLALSSGYQTPSRLCWT